MKKKGLALLLAATMICGLAACGKSGGETKTDAAADTAQTEDTGDTAAASGDGITVGWIVQDMATAQASLPFQIRLLCCSFFANGRYPNIHLQTIQQ